MSDTISETPQTSYITSFIDEMKHTDLINNFIRPHIHTITKKIVPYYVLVVLLQFVIIALLVRLSYKLK